MSLSVLTITEHGPHAMRFIDAHRNLAADLDARHIEVDGSDGPCLEAFLDKALKFCPRGYILRLDDDELPGPGMADWLAAGGYRIASHWAFPRFNLWPDAEHYATTEPLYPDLQTRLSLRKFSGGRTVVHQGSPYGTGEVAPCWIEHHKFLVRTEADRRALVQKYEALHPGGGEQYRVFSVPEDFILETAEVARATPVI